MKFSIVHELTYRYKKPVFLFPQSFYLFPRSDGFQTLHNIKLEVSPQPTLLTLNTDIFGNSYWKAWFGEKSESLKIVVRSEVHLTKTNSFDYLLDSGEDVLPLQQNTGNIFSDYALGRNTLEPEVISFSDSIREKSGNNTITFLQTLCNTIYEDFSTIRRPDGAAWSGIKTLRKKEGSCRDFAVLFAECCFAQNIPARLTSGYHEGDPDNATKDLHAWTEAFTKGGGWRGFDPTTGLAVSDRHIALASAPNLSAIAATSGAFAGESVKSTFKASIAMLNME